MKGSGTGGESPRGERAGGERAGTRRKSSGSRFCPDVLGGSPLDGESWIEAKGTRHVPRVPPGKVDHGKERSRVER